MRLMKLLAGAALVAGMALTGLSSHAANIVFVSDGTGTPDNDEGFVTLLTNAGHTVTRRADLTGALTDEKKAALNAADLIIMSRDLNSGNYNQPAGWNGLTAPILNMNAYLARPNRWGWLNTDNITERLDTLLVADLPASPLFASVGLDGDNKVEIHSQVTSLVHATSAGNGTVYAHDDATGYVMLASWQAGTLFYSGDTVPAAGPQTPAGNRVYFPAGWGFSSNTPEIGQMNLTADGQALFLNVVNTMVPEPGTLGLLAVGGIALLMRRRG